MVSKRLINYIREDLKGHDKEEIKKILVEQGYPKELADNAIMAAVESNEQEKEAKREEEEKGKQGIKELEEERESRKEQLKAEREQKNKEREIRREEFRIKRNENKNKLEGLKEKTIEKARKNSKVLILILIMIILGASFFVFEDFFNNKFYVIAEKTSNSFLCSMISDQEIKNNCYQKITRDIKIGLVTDLNGLGDKSFNDMAYKALLDSKEKYKIKFEVLEPKNEEEIEKSLRKFAEQKFDLIISMGFISGEAVNEVANEFPRIKFAIVDGIVKKPNVASLIFKEDEGSYLAGIMAGMMTKSNKIGFIGGVDIPIIKEFGESFKKGVESVNPDASLISQYMFSNDLAGFNSPEKGKEDAIELYNEGVDIIYHATGSSGDGIIEAAKEKDKYVIGMDFNQDYMAKGNVLTSVVKRVDNALLIIIDKLLNNNLEGGIYEFGLGNNGTSLTEFEYTKNIIPKEVIEEIEQAEQDIKSGKIKFY